MELSYLYVVYITNYQVIIYCISRSSSDFPTVFHVLYGTVVRQERIEFPASCGNENLIIRFDI